MLLLLDECVPRPLTRDFVGHDARHVVDLGSKSRRNGELLQLMVAEQFETSLTVDQNLEFEQNLRKFGIGVVVVIVRRNGLKERRPLVPQILTALDRMVPGSLVQIRG